MLRTFTELLSNALAFHTRQIGDLRALGINVVDVPVSHFAYRTKTFRDYVHVREEFEKHAKANQENVWNGRPISKILLSEPVLLSNNVAFELIELIPPFHQRVYPMGFEHIGYVIGNNVDSFGCEHRAVLTGQQFQSPDCEPYYVRFDDYTHAKFYRYSLMDVCKMEGAAFEGFNHADWQPDDIDAGPYPPLHEN